MLKKFGMVSVGVTAGLLAVAPVASATQGHEQNDSATSHHKSSDGKKEHKSGHGKSHGSQTCAFTGGDAETASSIDGDSTLGNVVAQAPIAGNNIGNVANCSSFLNDNLSDNHVSIADGLLGGGDVTSAPR